MKMRLNLILIICLIALCGCTYTLRMNQYPHLRNILVMPFENRTVELFLAETLHSSLITAFQQDGRLRIVYEEPDSRLEGEITSYSNTIYGFDMEQNIEEYMVSIGFSIVFSDLRRNEIIWESKSLSLSERYYPNMLDDHPLFDVRFKTEAEAQEEIFSNLFKQIIRYSLEAW